MWTTWEVPKSDQGITGDHKSRGARGAEEHFIEATNVPGSIWMWIWSERGLQKPDSPLETFAARRLCHGYRVDGSSFALSGFRMSVFRLSLIARFYIYVHFRIAFKHILLRAISAKPKMFNQGMVCSGLAVGRRPRDPN